MLHSGHIASNYKYLRLIIALHSKIISEMEVNKKKRGISLSHQLLAPSTAGNVSLPKHSDFRLELSESQAVIRKAIALTPSKPRVVYTPTPQISFAYVNQKV